MKSIMLLSVAVFLGLSNRQQYHFAPCGCRAGS